jgi:hypothetical protein
MFLRYRLPERVSQGSAHTQQPPLVPKCQSTAAALPDPQTSPSSSSRIQYVSLSMKDKPITALDSSFLQGHAFYSPSYAFFGDLSDVMLGLSISFNPSSVVYRDWGHSQAECH